MKKLPINPNVTLLLNYKFPNCNSLLIKDERIALIDTGLGHDLLKEILNEVKIDLLINTHTHPDHVAGNKIVSEMTSAEIYVPVEEEGRSLSMDKMKKDLGVWGKFVEPAWEKIITENMGFQESSKEITYKNGHIFDLGRIQLKAIHTPGHSKGHYCFLSNDKELLFASDLGIDSFGPWYGYLDSNLNEFLKSIDMIRSLNIDKALSSHHDTLILNIDEWLNRCNQIVNNREEKILGSLKEGRKDINDLSKYGIVYHNLTKISGPMKKFLTFFEENMLKEHLRILQNAGKVEEKNGSYRILS
ncbi:MAG: MBL fold metallo-hydrolase [Spirochaetota bacterium]|nr:MBL fold metallo-hydrolase [Spirochaetota bacterium]